MNNFYAVCPVRRKKIGTPSWLAAIRFRLYRMTHKAVYAPYERNYRW